MLIWERMKINKYERLRDGKEEKSYELWRESVEKEVVVQKEFVVSQVEDDGYEVLGRNLGIVEGIGVVRKRGEEFMKFECLKL